MPSRADSDFEFSFRTRHDYWNKLRSQADAVLNVVIIGGGIVGAGLLRILALRGLKDAYLFEKNDFASATSGASSKLIHAGIRYLEQAWMHLKRGRLIAAVQSFRYVVQASWERRVLGRMAPGLIRPRCIHLIISASDQRSTLSVLTGVWFYYLIQVFQGQFFSPPAVFLRTKTIKARFQGLEASNVKAVFRFWDSETDDARLVIENLQSAYKNGGIPLNYIEVMEYKSKGLYVELYLKNKETSETITVRSKLVINASGPFVDEVRKRGDDSRDKKRLVDRVAGSHIDVYPAFAQESFYITAADGRLIFLLKRDEDGLVYNRIGTTERPLASSEASDNPRPTSAETDYLVKAIKDFFPDAPIHASTIISSDAGIRPLKAQEGLNAFQKSREHGIVVENNVIHVIGVKLTDYRRVSDELVALIPWRKYDLMLGRTDMKASQAVLRPLPSRLYVEEGIQDLAKKTMILHWDDYLFRRRGLKPRVWAKKDVPRLRQEFEALAQTMGWDPDAKKREWQRMPSM